MEAGLNLRTEYQLSPSLNDSPQTNSFLLPNASIMDGFDSDPPLNNDSNAHDVSAVQRINVQSMKDLCLNSYEDASLIKKNKLKTGKLLILSLNCHSVRSQSKTVLLQSIIEEHQADIVIGCESYLDNSFSSQEIFPSQYVVVRKDCCVGCGGVFLALRNNLTCVEEPSFHGNAG